MARKYFIETYGCQMNVHDSERMAGLLDQAGYEATADDLDADVVLINTCSVREKAEEKLFTRLGEFHQRELETGERPIVAVAGCVAQQEGSQILQRSSAVDVILGTQNLKRLPMLVDQAVLDLRPLGPSIALGIAFVLVMIAAHWFWGDFLISPAARNWFFAADKWDYNSRLGPWRYQFWNLDRDASKNFSPMLFLRGIAIAIVYAVIGSRIGLWWGKGMALVKR